MISITILSKRILMLNYCLLTQTVFSNYSKDSKFFDETNKTVNGNMKDEFGGVIVIEFVGLKSKMYSMKKIDGKECNTAKGVSIATDFDKFKDVLFNEKIVRHKMKRIQSKKHKLGTYEMFMFWR